MQDCSGSPDTVDLMEEEEEEEEGEDSPMGPSKAGHPFEIFNPKKKGCDRADLFANSGSTADGAFALDCSKPICGIDFSAWVKFEITKLCSYFGFPTYSLFFPLCHHFTEDAILTKTHIFLKPFYMESTAYLDPALINRPTIKCDGICSRCRVW